MNGKKRFETARKNRLAAALLVAALIAFMLFSSLYIIIEADHDCGDAACPVCAMLVQCGNNLKQMGTVQLAILAAAVLCCLFAGIVCIFNTAVSFETPVSSKVRLNN